MKLKNYTLSGINTLMAFFLLFNCTQKRVQFSSSSFTKVDSLTEQYLALQDSILQTWNIMLNNDNQKIERMQNLLQKLQATHQYEPDEPGILDVFDQRLQQLTKMRYDQKSMVNDNVIDDYDFMSNSLVTELSSMVESVSDTSKSNELVVLINEIRSIDERVMVYRADYDRVVAKYNEFIDINKDYIKQIDRSNSLEKKPLFQLALDKAEGD